MTIEHGELAEEVLRRTLGEERIEDILMRFGLGAADRQLLRELMARWKPDYTAEHIAAICEDYKERSNFVLVMQAWETIAREAACTSEARRLPRHLRD